MSDSEQSKHATVGRNQWDLAAEAIAALGSSAPFVILAILAAFGVYQFLELQKDAREQIERERTEAAKAYNAQIESLNTQLQNSYRAMDETRQSSVDTLERTIALHSKVSDLVSTSQETMINLQQRVWGQQQELRDARTKLDEIKASTDEVARQNAEIEQQRRELSESVKLLEITAEVAGALIDVMGDDSPLPRPYTRESLAQRYEGQSPEHIGRDMNGTYYYGTYRVRADAELAGLLEMVSKTDPALGRSLRDAGGVDAAMKGDPRFQRAWLAAAGDPGLAGAETRYIEATVFNPVAAFLVRPAAQGGLGLDLAARSVAFRAVVWSTAVQHGDADARKIVKRALASAGATPVNDAELIRAIYAERGRVEQYFPSASPLLRRLLGIRYRLELDDALEILREETS